MLQTAKPRTSSLVAAFAAVYLVWGSTYWAIKLGLDSLPPFLLGGFRFLLAGALLLAWARWSGLGRPTVMHWRAAGVTGILMLLIGNGAVILAERRAPTGLVALIVTTVPIWMVLLDWLRPGGRRPSAAIFLGLGAGLLGIVLLVDPGAALGAAGVPPLEAGLLVIGGIAWAAGSLYSRSGNAPGPAPLLAALQMLVAGTAFLAVATVAGEWTGFRPGAVTLQAWLAVLYLALFGSVIAFSAYVWLVRVTTPTRASTYAYANPVVAVALGAILGGELVTGKVLLAGLVLLGAVLLINLGDHLGDGARRFGRRAARIVRFPDGRPTGRRAA